MMQFLAICLIFSTLVTIEKCDVYTSVSGMEKLLLTQKYLIEELDPLQRLVSDAKKRIIVIKYLSKLKKEHALSWRDPEHYLGNPANGYTLITRLHRDLKVVEKILKRVYRRNYSLVYPTEEDLKGATEALITLQSYYELELSDLANGTIKGNFSNQNIPFIENVTPMTAADCYDLGTFNYNKGNPTSALWYEEAYKKYKADKYFCNFNKEKLIDFISAHHYSAGDYKKAIYWMEKYLIENPNDFKTRSMVREMRELLKYKHAPRKIENQVPKKRSFLMESSYIKLCQGKYVKTENETQASMTCYYAHGPHPFLLLAPVKSETLHRDPDIIMFYNVTNDVIIQELKDHVKPKLVRAEGFRLNDVGMITSTRVNDYGRLPDGLPFTDALSARVHTLGDLVVTPDTSEPVWVINYGIGGYYEPHYDLELQISHPRKFPDSRLQKITTTIFYLSDVEQGGATVFPNIGVAVYPVKYAALFWTNLDPWGRSEHYSMHASCPVLRGSKWVATKWVKLHGQKKLCPLNYPGASRFEKEWPLRKRRWMHQLSTIARN